MTFSLYFEIFCFKFIRLIEINVFNNLNKMLLGNVLGNYSVFCMCGEEPILVLVLKSVSIE